MAKSLIFLGFSRSIKRVPTELADKSKIQLSNHWPHAVVCNAV